MRISNSDGRILSLPPPCAVKVRKQAIYIHGFVGFTGVRSVYYSKIVPDTRSPSRRPIHLPCVSTKSPVRWGVFFVLLDMLIVPLHEVELSPLHCWVRSFQHARQTYLCSSRQGVSLYVFATLCLSRRL